MSDASKEAHKDNYFCQLCSLEYTNKNDLEEHCWSLLHHKKLDKENGRGFNHKCTLCNEDFPGLLTYTKHIHSDKHLKKLHQWKEENSPANEVQAVTNENEPRAWQWPNDSQRPFYFQRQMQPSDGEAPFRPKYRHGGFDAERWRPRGPSPKQRMAWRPPSVSPYQGQVLPSYGGRWRSPQYSPRNHSFHSQMHNKRSWSAKGSENYYSGYFEDPFFYGNEKRVGYRFGADRQSLPEIDHYEFDEDGERKVREKFKGFDAIKSMRQKMKRFKQDHPISRNSYSSSTIAPSSSQVVSGNVPQVDQHETSNISDLNIERPDSFQIISSKKIGPQSQEIRTKERRRSVSNEQANCEHESGAAADCPFVGSNEEEVLASYVAGSLGCSKTSQANGHARENLSEMQAIALDGSSRRDISRTSGSKTVGNRTTLKSGRRERLYKDKSPASNTKSRIAKLVKSTDSSAPKSVDTVKKATVCVSSSRVTEANWSAPEKGGNTPDKRQQSHLAKQHMRGSNEDKDSLVRVVSLGGQAKTNVVESSALLLAGRENRISTDAPSSADRRALNVSSDSSKSMEAAQNAEQKDQKNHVPSIVSNSMECQIQESVHSSESSIVSLDESLMEANTSKQCEFRYQDGRRCPTPAAHKFCAYHEKVVRDVYIYYAKVTNAQKSLPTDPMSSSVSGQSKQSPETNDAAVPVVEHAAATTHADAGIHQSEASNPPSSIVEVASDTEADGEHPSLHSRFRHLHRATKNPLSGLELFRGSLPPTVRKLLSRKYGSERRTEEDSDSAVSERERQKTGDVTNESSKNENPTDGGLQESARMRRSPNQVSAAAADESHIPSDCMNVSQNLEPDTGHSRVSSRVTAAGVLMQLSTSLTSTNSACNKKIAVSLENSLKAQNKVSSTFSCPSSTYSNGFPPTPSRSFSLQDPIKSPKSTYQLIKGHTEYSQMPSSSESVNHLTGSKVLREVGKGAEISSLSSNFSEYATTRDTVPRDTTPTLKSVPKNAPISSEKSGSLLAKDSFDILNPLPEATTVPGKNQRNKEEREHSRILPTSLARFRSDSLAVVSLSSINPMNVVTASREAKTGALTSLSSISKYQLLSSAIPPSTKPNKGPTKTDTEKGSPRNTVLEQEGPSSQDSFCHSKSQENGMLSSCPLFSSIGETAPSGHENGTDSPVTKPPLQIQLRQRNLLRTFFDNLQKKKGGKSEVHSASISSSVSNDNIGVKAPCVTLSVTGDDIPHAFRGTVSLADLPSARMVDGWQVDSYQTLLDVPNKAKSVSNRNTKSVPFLIRGRQERTPSIRSDVSPVRMAESEPDNMKWNMKGQEVSENSKDDVTDQGLRQARISEGQRLQIEKYITTERKRQKVKKALTFTRSRIQTLNQEMESLKKVLTSLTSTEKKLNSKLDAISCQTEAYEKVLSNADIDTEALRSKHFGGTGNKRAEVERSTLGLKKRQRDRNMNIVQRKNRFALEKSGNQISKALAKGFGESPNEEVSNQLPNVVCCTETRSTCPLESYQGLVKESLTVDANLSGTSDESKHEYVRRANEGSQKRTANTEHASSPRYLNKEIGNAFVCEQDRAQVEKGEPLTSCSPSWELIEAERGFSVSERTPSDYQAFRPYISVISNVRQRLGRKNDNTPLDLRPLMASTLQTELESLDDDSMLCKGAKVKCLEPSNKLPNSLDQHIEYQRELSLPEARNSPECHNVSVGKKRKRGSSERSRRRARKLQRTLEAKKNLSVVERSLRSAWLNSLDGWNRNTVSPSYLASLGQTGRDEKVLSPHRSAVAALKTYNSFLYSGSCDKTIQIHDCKSGIRIPADFYFKKKKKLNCLEIFPRGTQTMLSIGCQNGWLMFYDLRASNKWEHQMKYAESIVALHMAFGKLFVGLSNGVIKRVNLLTFKNEDESNTLMMGSVVCIHSAVSAATLQELLVALIGNEICIFRAQDSLSITTKLEGNSLARVTCIEVFKQYIYAADEQGLVSTYEIDDNFSRRIFCQQQASEIVTTMKAGGGLLVTASVDRLIRCYDITNGNLMVVLGGHRNVISALELDVAGQKTVYSGCLDGEIRSSIITNKIYHCQWDNCLLPFCFPTHLRQHIISFHIKPSAGVFTCKWSGCNHLFPRCIDIKVFDASHIMAHIESSSDNKPFESCNGKLS